MVPGGGVVTGSTPVVPGGGVVTGSTPVVPGGGVVTGSTPVVPGGGVVTGSTPVVPGGGVVTGSTPVVPGGGVVTGSTPVVPGGGVVTGSTPVVPGGGVVTGSTPVVPGGGVVTGSTPVVPGGGVVTGSTPVVPGGGVVTGSTSVVPGTGTGSGITPVPAGIVTPTTPGGIGARRTLWFQTGKLTGGSANILDLSLSGKGGGSGGVHLLNPSLSITRHITLRLHGTDYYNNLVIFPQTSSGESNGTWRLQMRGQSTSGQRFTQHTRLGQLKDKILVLEEISPDHYEVTVEPDSKLIHYRAISSFVEQSPPRGRYYGII